MFKEIDFKSGKITYNDFDIDFNVSFENQLYSYKEDLFQVTYANDCCIDVGYYPEFDPKGWFKVQVIKNYDWQYPVFLKRCKTEKTLKELLKTAALIAHIYSMKN